jgi:hypothetical protein
MDYSYQSSGFVKFFGCPIILIRRLYPSKFSVGEILYVLRKARLGILEKVAVKKVNLNLHGNEASFIYKDTFNSLYNEEELCRYIEAQQEVQSFKEYIENLIMNSNGCGVSEYLINSISYGHTTDVRRTLRHIKQLVKGLSSNNFKTKYFDVDVKAKDIIKEIDSILLDGGRP